VNDGICDYEFCCDGSDEWAHVGGTKCEDKCKEIGKQWRKQEERRAKSMTAALKKKKELLVDSGRQQKEVEDQIKRLEVEIQAQEMKVKDMEAEFEEVKKREESKMVRGKKAGKVNILASLAKGRVEELRNALVEVRKERDETRSRLKELEDILSKFKIEYNPNFNDEGVKRAVRSWEEYAAREDVGNLGNSVRDRDLDEIAKPDDDTSGVNWEQWENEEDETDTGSCFSYSLRMPVRFLTFDLVYKLAAYLPPSAVSFVEDKVISIRRFLEDNGILPKKEESSTAESKAVAEAREGLEKTKTNLAELYTELKNHQADLETNYGKAGVFRALKGVCISKDSGEYTYEHCFLDETKQIPKKGGASVRMGKFGRIGSVSVDELNETGEIVAEERISLMYTNGQTCWNGPARSTTVILECGEENEILKVTEDEKCVYSMIVTTPAVCPGGEEEGDVAPRRKDEL
jgi:protein kinase C substrate 80K-H